MYNDVIGTQGYEGYGHLGVMACQETNGFDSSSIRPPVVELCQVAGRMKRPFKDICAYN